MKTTSKEPSISKLSNLLQPTPSDLTTLEGILSEIQSMKKNASGDLEETGKLQTRELHIKHLIKGLKNPKDFLRDEFKKRVDYFHKPSPGLTSGYFDFLDTYLMCCYFAIKYRGELGYSFPPNDKDYTKFSELVVDSYESKTIGEIEKPGFDAIFGNDFFEDAARRFNNIQIQKEESFFKLSCYFKLMLSILQFNTRDILPFLEPEPQPSPWNDSLSDLVINLSKNLEARSKKSIETLIDEKIIEGWGLDLVCRAMELIGYWTKEIEAWKKQQIRASGERSAKVKRMKDEIQEYLKVNNKISKEALRRFAEKYDVGEQRIYQLKKEIQGEEKKHG